MSIFNNITMTSPQIYFLAFFMQRHNDHNEVETQVSKSTAETARVTGEFAKVVPDLLRFGHGRYRAAQGLCGQAYRFERCL